MSCAVLSCLGSGDGFDTKAGVLSGGMRRRLSIAMSIVGDPPIVFMDGTYSCALLYSLTSFL